jgi:hypothetical protein
MPRAFSGHHADSSLLFFSLSCRNLEKARKLRKKLNYLAGDFYLTLHPKCKTCKWTWFSFPRIQIRSANSRATTWRVSSGPVI